MTLGGQLLKWLTGPAVDVSVPGKRGVNFLRGAVSRITTPLLPDDYLKLANPLWSARELRGRIVEVRRETVDSVTLVIKPGWGFDFDYQAGQYIGIGILVDGRWHWRSYSLTSAPDRQRHGRHTERGLATRPGDTITIAVKAMPEGFLSSHLVGGVPPGTVVRLAAPAGDFVLPDPPPEKVLFLTAGSGITPVLAMLRTLDRRQRFGDVVHVHSAPTVAETMFADELAQLCERNPGYRCHIQLTRDNGKFELASLDDRYPDWRARQTWACGPVAMLDEIAQLWRAEGITDRLHQERFELERTASGAGGTITFGHSRRSVDADGATTVLQAGESVGVAVPFGCRMGICRTCVVGLTEGAVIDLRSGARHEAGEKIQSCVCAAAGDCIVDC